MTLLEAAVEALKRLGIEDSVIQKRADFSQRESGFGGDLVIDQGEEEEVIQMMMAIEKRRKADPNYQREIDERAITLMRERREKSVEN